MTAQEARELTLSKKKDLEDIMESIKIMAQAGQDSATFRHWELKQPAEFYMEKLEEKGFDVTESLGFIQVKW